MNQQIQIKSSICHLTENREHDSNYLLKCSRSTNQSSVQITGNCYIQNRSNSEKASPKSSKTTKIKYKKLLELYNQALEKLSTIKQEITVLQEKKKNQEQIKSSINISNQEQVLQEKRRKGSQVSTAGEDQDFKPTLVTKTANSNYENNCEIISALKKKLFELKQSNRIKSSEQTIQISKLREQLEKNRIQTNNKENSNRITHKTDQSILKAQENKLKQLQKIKLTLQESQSSLKKNIQKMREQIQSFQNNVEYLKQTQNGCQQILDDQIRQIKYKIQRKSVQYESNRKYLQKIGKKIRQEQNVSFDQIKQEISQLNQQCQLMMSKKSNYYNPQIKKYKQKRQQFVQQVQKIKLHITQKQQSKKLLQQKITQQNKIHQQLQNEYFDMFQKLDQKIKQGKLNVYSEEQLKLFRQKQQLLVQEIKQIQKKSQNVKKDIQGNQNLVPQSLIKEYHKKIKMKKQQLKQALELSQNNQKLQKQNAQLNIVKQKIQWSPNSDIQKHLAQEKSLLSTQNQLNQKVKQLKRQNQIIEQKINKAKQNQDKQQKLLKEQIEEQEKMKKQLREKLERQRIQKENQEKIRVNREKLIQKFRESKGLEQEDRQNTTQDNKKANNQQSNHKQNNYDETKKGKMKKGKNSNQRKSDNKLSSSIKFDHSREKGFFGLRENPLDILKSDFPLNRSQELSQNVSLLQSNPALYMFAIFVSVVIPGLCIGYNF